MSGNFQELVRKRYSVRNYLDRPVEEEKLNYILESGRLAPSAVNYQPYAVIVVRDEVVKKTLCSVYSRPWLLQAPVILVVCGNHDTSWKRTDGKDFADIDVSILVDHMTLAATEQGLGTCWVCNFDANRCSEILHLPEEIEPVVLLPVGYPDEKNVDRSRHLVRKNLKDIVHWDKY